jgi:hypothetical protein
MHSCDASVITHIIGVVMKMVAIVGIHRGRPRDFFLHIMGGISCLPPAGPGPSAHKQKHHGCGDAHSHASRLRQPRLTLCQERTVAAELSNHGAYSAGRLGTSCGPLQFHGTFATLFISFALSVPQTHLSPVFKNEKTRRRQLRRRDRSRD